MIDLDPELTFVGDVLALPVATAQQALAVIADADLADPRLRLILQAMRHLVADGVPPAPYAVMAAIRRTGVATTENELQLIARLIIEASEACTVAVSWRFDAAAVLDETLRRRCRELVARIAQAADGALDTLVELVHTERSAVLELDRRRAALLPARQLEVAA